MYRKVCPKCGAEGNQSAKFCRKCGSPLVNEKMGESFCKAFFERYKRARWGKEETTDQARFITSPEPLPNEMIKVKKIYYIFLICVAIGVVVPQFFVLGLFGLLITWLVDIIMTEYKVFHLNRFKFQSISELTDERVFEEMQPVLLAMYGVYAEKDEEGKMVVSINDFYYTIILNSDSTFCIHWSLPLKKGLSMAFLREMVYYKYYRELLGGMGILSHEIQAHFGILDTVDAILDTAERSQQFSEQPESVREKYSYSSIWKQALTSKTNWLAVVCSILTILCIFLPFVTMSTYGITAVQTLIDGGDGYFFLVLAIISIIFSLKGKDTGVSVVSVLVCVLAVIEIYDTSTFISESDFGTLIERGSGFYVMILSSIGLVISGFYRKMVN